jgi:hypothetical protein
MNLDLIIIIINNNNNNNHVQNGSGAHSASYPMVTRGSFLGVEAAGA